jgi:cyclic pyranopterin phosphate synthase
MLKLKDTFGRIHDYLRISLTDHCNLRCSYCMPEHIRFMHPELLLTSEEIINLSTLFVNDFGIRKIRLTGGEPLLFKGFENVIEKLSELPTEIALTTNGILLDKHIWLFIEKGIKNINVSLDTLNPNRFEQITHRPMFNKVFRNINLALSSDLNIKVNMVVIGGFNEDEVIEFVEWTVNRPVHVRFIEFMPFNGNNWRTEKLITFSELLDRISDIFPVEKLDDSPNSTSKNYKITGSEGSFAFISTVSSPFCSSCNRLRLTADGKLRNCLFAQNEIDLLSSFRKGEDIRSLILSGIQSKAEIHGGLNLKAEFTKRSMIRIGG